MLHAIHAFVREKRLLFAMAAMALAVTLAAILSFGVLYRRSMNAVLAPKILMQNEAMLDINTQAFDDILQQCKRVSVAIQNDRRFTAEYIANHVTAFIDIDKTLANYVSFMPSVEDIFFANQAYPGIFTSQGVYNPIYFEPPRNMNAAGFNTRVYRANLRYGSAAYFTSALNGSLLFENRNSVIEYILPVQYGKGAIGFRILTNALLPGHAQIQLIFMDPAGQLLHHSPGLTLEQAEYITTLPMDSPSGTLDMEGHRHYYSLQRSPASGAQFLYLISYDIFTAEIRSLDLLFLSVCGAVLLLCAGLSTGLMRFAYAPVHRMRKTLIGAPIHIPPGLDEAGSADYALSALGTEYDALQQRHRTVQQAQLLRRLLARDSGGDFQAACAAAGLRTQARHFTVMMLSSGVEDERRAQLMVEEAVFLLSRRYETIWLDYARGMSFVLLLAADAPIALPYLTSVSEHLSVKYERIFSLGISAPYQELHRTHQAFLEARMALRACGKREARSYCFYGAMPKSVECGAPYPRTEIEGLQDAIARQSPEHISTLVEVLIRTVKEESSLPLCLCYDIVNTMLHAAHQNSALAAQLAESPRYAYETIEFVSLADFTDFIRGLTQLILDSLNLSTDLYRKAVAFIDERVTDAQLYADKVAAQLGVSAQKLNQLFKDNSAQTVTAFIAQRRHAYIKRMLIASEIPVQALALQMGYSQPSSFIRYFKQEEGMPPGEYRARYREGPRDSEG